MKCLWTSCKRYVIRGLLVCKYVPLWVPFDSYEALNIGFTLDVYVHIELDAITNVGRSSDPSCRWIASWAYLVSIQDDNHLQTFPFHFRRSCNLSWRRHRIVECCLPTKLWMVQEAVTGQYGGRKAEEKMPITMMKIVVMVTKKKRHLDQEWALVHQV